MIMAHPHILNRNQRPSFQSYLRNKVGTVAATAGKATAISALGKIAYTRVRMAAPMLPTVGCLS